MAAAQSSAEAIDDRCKRRAMAVFGLLPLRLAQAIVYRAGLPYLRTVLFALASSPGWVFSGRL
jgi:hypothetical protein